MSIISIGIPIPDRSALPGQTGSGEEVNLQYATQNYCANSSNASPTVATPAGGTFSYAPGGISGGANGTIVIANSFPGNYTVTYTVNGDSANFPINISALDDASFSYSASAFCADASNQTPTIATSGGTFTSQDITFRPFKMKISVTSGVEKTFNLGISGIGNQFQIDWGDGTVGQANVIGLSHTYNPGGVGTTVDPVITLGAQTDTVQPRSIYFRNNSSALDILEIQQWGIADWQSIYHGFWDARNMDITATDTPTITAANWTNLFYMSSNNTSLIGASLANWDVSSATNIASLFMRCTSFNANISNWNVSNNTSLSYMFYGSSSFNQNLSNWDITSLTSATSMFNGASSLTVANYTDTVVGWAVTVYKNGGTPSSVSWTGTTPNFDGTRTSDDASGQTYAVKYGSDWTATGWFDSQDAFDYLTTTLSWTIN